jgi:hypothetical protein
MTTHGMSKTSAYHRWESMKQRCLNPRNDRFEWYGARGILPCEDWRLSFEAYFADTGDPPEGCSLDRPNNDRGYEPRNFGWASAKQQARNRRPPAKRRQPKPITPLDDPPF